MQIDPSVDGLNIEKSNIMDCCRSAACRAQEETLKLNKTYTEFVFFKASPDESTVEVVYSFPAGTASPWAGQANGRGRMEQKGKQGPVQN